MTARAALSATIAFAAAATFSFGVLLSETLLLYANIFADVPSSFAVALQFMSVVAPGDVLPRFGAMTVATAVAAVALTVRTPAVRAWTTAAAIVLLLGQFLFSALFFWPRNRIMFTEGLAVHDATYLQQVAAEFQAAHWVRVAAGAATAVLAFVGMLRMHREYVTTRLDVPAR